jgi:hypothetical protein
MDCRVWQVQKNREAASSLPVGVVTFVHEIFSLFYLIETLLLPEWSAGRVLSALSARSRRYMLLDGILDLSKENSIGNFQSPFCSSSAWTHWKSISLP